MYRYIQYNLSDYFVSWNFESPLPHNVPSYDNCVLVEVDFYNPNIVGCYYKDGIFYEDAELTKIIDNPVNYIRQIGEIE